MVHENCLVTSNSDAQAVATCPDLNCNTAYDEGLKRLAFRAMATVVDADFNIGANPVLTAPVQEVA